MRRVQVWTAILAALLGVTLVYHVLRWVGAFGDYSRIRMRMTNEPPGRVREYIVASCTPLLTPTLVHGSLPGLPPAPPILASCCCMGARLLRHHLHSIRRQPARPRG